MCKQKCHKKGKCKTITANCNQSYRFSICRRKKNVSQFLSLYFLLISNQNQIARIFTPLSV